MTPPESSRLEPGVDVGGGRHPAFVERPRAPLARQAFDAGVRCRCGHLPWEHGAVNAGCSILACECATYDPDPDAPG
jgi:hypothetical protein